MPGMRKDVQFWGEILPGRERETVKAAVARTFKASPEQVERLFSGKRVIVARGVDEGQAQRMLEALEKAGARAAIVPSTTAASQAPASGHTPPPPSAPAGAQASPPRPPAVPPTRPIPPPHPPSPRPFQHSRPGKAPAPVAPVSRRRVGLYVGIPAALAVLAILYVAIRPINPPRSSLLRLANDSLAGVRSIASAIEGDPDIQGLDSRDESGLPAKGITAGQLEVIAKDVLQQSKGASLTAALGAKLDQAGLREEVKAADERIKSALADLERAARRPSEPYRSTLKNLRTFHEICIRFDEFALAPSRHASLVEFATKYRLAKSVVASGYTSLVKEIESLNATTSGPEGAAWQAELNRSKEARDSLVKR